MTYLVFLEDGITNRRYVIAYNPKLIVVQTYWTLFKRLFN